MQLNSPDQLDQLMQVTSRKEWIALISIGVLLLTALTWSILGSIPNRISGPCIFLKEGGIFQVVSQGAGQIESMIPMKPGDHIEKGQEIATVSQTVLRYDYNFEISNLEELKREEAHIKDDSDRSLALNHLHLDKKLDEIDIGKKAKTLLVESLISIVMIQEGLLKDGIITRQTYETTRQSLFQARQDIQSFEAQRRQITYDLQVAESTAKQKKMDAHHNVQAAQAKLNDTEAKLLQQSKIISPFSGQIIEVKAFIGDTIKEMSTIVDIVDDTQDTNVIMYIPPFGEAKNIRSGMSVQVSPDSHKKEDYGFIHGHVSAVSMFPATREGMIAFLDSPQLVDSLSAKGPTLAVNVDLANDSTTQSKFKWSSSAGSNAEISIGSTCTAQIKLRDRPPITLVMPWLKKAFGII